MATNDFENLKRSRGGLISFNSFLSTSTDRDVSYTFADSSRQKSNTVGVLFIIKIDSTISTVPYASSKNISYYSNDQNTEDEILFSMHTVYRIGDMDQFDDHFWQVTLILTNDNDKQLKRLTDYVREEELRKADGMDALVPLLIKMGEFNTAERICQSLFQLTSGLNLKETMSINYHLGQIKYAKGDYSKAISFFTTAIDLEMKSPQLNVLNLVALHNGIGLCHNSTDNYSAALFYYQNALNMEENNYASDSPNLATSYNNIAQSYVLLTRRLCTSLVFL